MSLNENVCPECGTELNSRGICIDCGYASRNITFRKLETITTDDIEQNPEWL